MPELSVSSGAISSEVPSDLRVPSPRQGTERLGHAIGPAGNWGFGPLFDAIKDAVVVANASTGRILLWNQGAEGLFQYTATEAQHLLLEDLVPEPLKEAHRKGLARFAETGSGELLDSHAPVEVPAIRKDGVQCLVQLTLSRIESPDDPAGAYAMGLLRDVTRLREKEQTVKLMLNAAAQPMFALDVLGNCTLANPAAAHLLGYEPEELEGLNMHAVMHHSYLDGSPFPAEDCQIFQTFRAGVPGHTDSEVFWRRDGTAFPADYRSQPILQGDTLLGAVVGFTDISEAREREAVLRNRANTDVLTGIGNRGYANEVLARLQGGDAVVMIDLDGFKAINDTYGHSAGDEILVALAAHLLERLREGDCLARFGGEEFLLVLRDAAQSAPAIVQRIAQEWQSLDRPTTFSAGIAVHRSGSSPLNALERADAAMYEAKRQGRDRIVHDQDPSSSNRGT